MGKDRKRWVWVTSGEVTDGYRRTRQITDFYIGRRDKGAPTVGTMDFLSVYVADQYEVYEGVLPEQLHWLK